MSTDTSSSREVRQFIRRRVRGGDIVLFLFLGGAALLFVNFTFAQIIGFLYQPVTGLILLLLIAQFLWLKSGDRTRVYRIEIERLRKQRRRDEELLRRCGEELLELQRTANPKDKERIKALTKQLRERI